jgi:prophage antirepressor-like protein
MKELVRMFGDSPVRAVVIKGEPWWVLKDVCVVLGLTNSRMVADRLDDDEKGVSQSDTLGGKQDVTIVNESGLYSVILRSDKPEAKAFRRWITQEVLPAIRKTGRYAVNAEARRDSAAARSALTAEWLAHGADKFYHYINLTKAEYDALFGDKAKKKADMTKEELAALMVFESIEHLKLVKNPELQGYRALADSIAETGHQLPMFTSLIAGTLPRGVTA